MNRETMRAMKSCNLFLTLLLSMTAGIRAASPEQTALAIIEQSGVRGGFIAHLGCGDGKLTAALRISDSYQVQGIDRDRAKVNSARSHIDSRDIYGSVSADYLDGQSLPYSDNMVNLLVCEDPNTLAISASEIQRVLVPNGIALIKQGKGWKKTQKPRPDNIDEWTHFLHSATGNAVAKDDVVGPPRHLQWIGNPRWSRHHDRMASTSAMVSANGRIFYIMDAVTGHDRLLLKIKRAGLHAVINKECIVFNGRLSGKTDLLSITVHKGTHDELLGIIGCSVIINGINPCLLIRAIPTHRRIHQCIGITFTVEFTNDLSCKNCHPPLSI